MPGLRDIFRGEDARRAAEQARQLAEQRRQEQKRQADYTRSARDYEERQRIYELQKKSISHLEQQGLDRDVDEIGSRKGSGPGGGLKFPGADFSRHSHGYSEEPGMPEGSYGRRTRWGKRIVGGGTNYDEYESSEVAVASDPEGNVTVNGRRVGKDKKAIDKALGKAYEHPRKVREKEEHGEYEDPGWI